MSQIAFHGLEAVPEKKQKTNLIFLFFVLTEPLT